jgi:predicted Zn finger-like uncharacterized protein
MKIVCPHCNFSREVPDGQIPDRPVKVTCPHCQQGFAFNKASANPAPVAGTEAVDAPRPTATSGPPLKTCPACGLEQPAGEACAGCGLIYAKWEARRETGGTSGPRTPPGGATSQTNDFRVICNACGAVQPPGSHCMNCGTPLMMTTAARPDPQQPFAGFWTRFVAYLLDTTILGAVQFVVSLALGFAGGSLIDSGGGMAMAMISALCGTVISIAYAVFFTGYNGQTPGKMALRIQVVRCDGTPMTYGRAFLREVIGKFASAIILGIGYLMVAFDRNKQGLHDKIAGTYVIKL